MTQQQQEQLARALDRARKHGLAIVGRGTWDGGARFLVVGSASEPGRFHLVTVYPGRLVCDCPSRTLCQHWALAHEELAREAEEDRAARQIMGSLDRTGRELTARFDALFSGVGVSAPAPAPVPTAAALRDSAPLYGSNAGFSIWKA